MSDYKEGSIIKCQVTGVEKYGIFINTENDYTGLIHISEVSNSFVRDVNDYVKVGEEIYCQVLEVDENNKQLKLSIKNINYKSTVDDKKIQESRLGFLPLKNALPGWIEDKLNDYRG